MFASLANALEMNEYTNRKLFLGIIDFLGSDKQSSIESTSEFTLFISLVRNEVFCDGKMFSKLKKSTISFNEEETICLFSFSHSLVHLN